MNDIFYEVILFIEKKQNQCHLFEIIIIMEANTKQIDYQLCIYKNSYENVLSHIRGFSVNGVFWTI